MFVVFYMLLWRPQQQQQKRRREMLASLKKGDRVVTAGGIHGEITGMKEDTLTVRIADKVEVKISKSGVSQVKG
ncbi:MAG: preprotein translocase subunit YajC [Firmicutes bacterium]|nr:preprotein translocase subunit YajC [Bacillota bacterium]